MFSGICLACSRTRIFLLAMGIFVLGSGLFVKDGAASWTTPKESDIRQVEALHRQAEEMIALNKFREAINLCWEILLIEPDDELAYTRLGHVYLVQGNTKMAENAFKNALHINPRNEWAFYGLETIRHPDEMSEQPAEPSRGESQNPA